MSATAHGVFRAYFSYVLAMMSDTDPNHSAITLVDIHQAIERLAIDQTAMGLAIMRIVAENQSLSEEERDKIHKSMLEVTERLSELANKFLDTPYGG